MSDGVIHVVFALMFKAHNYALHCYVLVSHVKSMLLESNVYNVTGSVATERHHRSVSRVGGADDVVHITILPISLHICMVGC